ncbi:MAG TPA: class I SAM-dependent methyltransferase [Candidatus Aquicultor sp.]
MGRFDQFSENYKDILDQHISVSGESSEYFTEYKACYIAKLVPTNSPGKLLDFGCGVGLLSSYLKQYMPTCTLHGYDVSSASIERIDPDLTARGMFTSDQSKLDNDYDAIIVSNVLHHIEPKNREGTILALRERLSSGGKLIVFEHNPANHLTRKVVDKCPFDEGVELLPLRETVAHMSKAGLGIGQSDYIVFFPHFLKLFRPLEPLISWCSLGAQYALVGEKHG